MATAVAGGLAAWLLGMAASNLPDRSFDRLRRLDRWGVVLPNWRFFAPVPVEHDWHLVYRVLTADQRGAWEEAAPPTPRSALHALWFPARRRDKAISDLAFELAALKGRGAGGEVLAASLEYRVLQGVVEAAIGRRALGAEPAVAYQFAVLRSAGHDREQPLRRLLLSAVIARAGAATGGGTAALRSPGRGAGRRPRA